MGVSFIGSFNPERNDYAGLPSVEFIFGEDDMSDLAFSISDNRLSVMK
jgi:hypothetical protein